jgi:adenylosuccinate synthase|tara:strand:- start:734 stop:1927 length:1194 start_codon:yes stop_codon:yes gene_type:complete
MSNLVVIGTQWGDEGKGKVVDLLSEQADIIVRFQGGHNAGHTLVIEDKVFKLSLLPSGIIREDKITVIGNGVVLDPWKLIEEIDLIRSQGINIDNKRLLIAENTPLIMPYHKQLDQSREETTSNKIGTTGRGIGPAYEDKVGRRAIKVSDLRDIELLENRLKIASEYHGFDTKVVLGLLLEIKDEVIQYIAPVADYLNEMTDLNKNIVFEGAQGSMLDVDFGTYPYVTSSNTFAGMASIGSGVPHNRIPTVIGITKAYTTRVGEGPMVTELFDEIGDHLATVGKEKGTVTGRGRRCGWFDAPQVKRTCMLNGVTGVALTKIDVLDELEEIKIYIGDNQYKTLPGWRTSTVGITEYEDLPRLAQEYIEYIEDLIKTQIVLISTGPERDQTILLDDNLF